MVATVAAAATASRGAACRGAAQRRHAGGALLLAAVGLGALALGVPGAGRGGLPFAAPQGLSRKQTKSSVHTRGQLPPVLEVPLEDPEPDEPDKEPLPERRAPYTLHIVSHFPNNKHLREESRARNMIEQKITNAFENTADIIRHVEVNLQVSENFHRDMSDKSARPKVQEVDRLTDDDEIDTPMLLLSDSTGSREIAPYLFKVTVSLKSGRRIVLANAEKHAQPTFTEGLDHMVDVMRNSLREEKEKIIQSKRKRMAEAAEIDDGSPLEDEDVESVVDDKEVEGDKEMEKLYSRVEAAAEASAGAA